MIDHDHAHWLEAQQEEQSWWGDCANTYWEEHKQLTYAYHMDIKFVEDGCSPYNIEIGNKAILDVGGGPCSLLLKTTRHSGYTSPKWNTLVDPCGYPDWVYYRYYTAGIRTARIPAEMMSYPLEFDEVWIYNVLQHTEEPSTIMQNAMRAVAPGGILRVFEWIDTPTNEAHPHSLSLDFFESRLGPGSVVELAEHGCYGRAFAGAFYF